jgi:hypothetical protein
MKNAANVTALEALTDLHAALAQFQTAGRDALGAVEAAIRRAFDWLDDQRRTWQKEIRHWQDEAVAAKSALNRKQTVAWGDRVPDTTEEEETLERAERNVRHAEEQVARCRAWEPRLRRAVEEYEGPGRKLGFILDGDVPKHLAQLDRMSAALEAYTQIAAPTARPAPPPPTPKAE